MDAEGDVARILHHISQQLAEQRRTDGVDLLVAVPHRQRFLDVMAGVAVEHLLELAEDHGAHMLDAADQLGRMKFAVESHHPLADVLGKIADTFEVVGDAQRPDDFPQVDCHGLAPGDRQHGLFLDLSLQRINIGVCGHRLLRAIGITVRERIDRVGNLLLGKTTHLRHEAGELLQVDVEGLGGVIGDDHLFRPGWRTV
jgi:hypothetical protein